MHLYVTEQGTRLNKCGEHLVVQRDGTTIDDILLSEVDSLSLFGAVHPTTGAILALLDKGTDIAFLSSGGRYRGRLVSSIGKNVPLRLCQYDAFRNRERAFELAKACIVRKLENGFLEAYKNANFSEALRRVYRTTKRNLSRLSELAVAKRDATPG